MAFGTVPAVPMLVLPVPVVAVALAALPAVPDGRGVAVSAGTVAVLPVPVVATAAAAIAARVLVVAGVPVVVVAMGTVVLVGPVIVGADGAVGAMVGAGAVLLVVAVGTGVLTGVAVGDRVPVTVEAVVAGAVGPGMGTTVAVDVGTTGVTGGPAFRGVAGAAGGGGAGGGRSGDSVGAAGGGGVATTVGGVKVANRFPAMSPRRAASRHEKLSVLVPPRNSRTVNPAAVCAVTASPLQSPRGVRNTWYPLVTATAAKSGSSATVAVPPVSVATPKSSNQGSGDSVQYNRR